jgi:hypothetical protein
MFRDLQRCQVVYLFHCKESELIFIWVIQTKTIASEH